MISNLTVGHCVANLGDPTWRLFLGSGITILMFFCVWELLCRQPMTRHLPQRSFLSLAGMLSR